MAESLSDCRNKRLLSCLIDKGRLLVESGSQDSFVEGRRLLEDTLQSWKDICGDFMWFLAMQSFLRVDRSKCDEVTDKFLKEERLFHPSLGAMYSAVLAQLDFKDEEVNEENFIRREEVMVERLRRVIDHLENFCRNGEHEDEKLLQDGLTYTYLWSMSIAFRCLHALSESDAKQHASKALKLSTSPSFIRSDRNEELSFIMNCDSAQFVLMKKKCYIEQMGKRIPVKKEELEKDIESLLVECEKYQDVWSWVIGGLKREHKKLHEKVMPFLLRHTEPGEILLTLVLHTFVDQIEAYKKDSNVNVTPEEVVKEILKAITHVENLLANKTTMQGSNSCALKDALKKWYTQLALRTKQCLSRADRRKYARKALSLLEEGDPVVANQEKQFLKGLAS